MNSVHSQPRDRDSGSFSTESAFETDLALKEARRWVEEVTGEKFRSPRFKASLQDGILLCKLVNELKPGIVRKINTIRTTMCYMENVSFFLNACKELGLKDAQLFDVSDLQDVPRRKEAKGGSLRGDYERTLRNVCITIYWLGRVANRISGYKGPQLDEGKFMELIGAHSLAGDGNRPIGGFHTIDREDYDDATLDRESLAAALKSEKEAGGVSENGGSAVQRAEIREKSPMDGSRTREHFLSKDLDNEKEKPAAAVTVEHEQALPRLRPKMDSAERVKSASSDDAAASKRASDIFRDTAISVDMLPGESKFGFSVVGGKDEGFQVKVDSVQSGLPAERAGLRRGDLLLWVNGQTVLNANHRQVVSLITECLLQRSITLGVRRTMPRPGSTIEDGDAAVSTLVSPAKAQPTKSSSSGSSDTAATPTRRPEAIKKRYKTSRALEVHFQTKKRTRTEVTCHEEEEEQPASLQSGRSRRIVHITRAELVRHFETSTKPKKEIAWLIIYAGGLFTPVPVQVTSTTVQRQRAQVLPGGSPSGTRDTAPAATVVVQRAARPSSQVIDQSTPIVVEQVAPVVVTSDVVERQEVPMESFVPDEKKRQRLPSDDDDDGAKRETREKSSSSSSSSSSSDDADVPPAKKAGGRESSLPMDVGEGGAGEEEVVSATRHDAVRIAWGRIGVDDDDQMDYDDHVGSRDHVTDDDDEVVLRGIKMANVSESHRPTMDFDTRGMVPIDETHDSVMLDSVVESTMDWDDFERLGERDDETTTTASAQPRSPRHRATYISEGEFEELNTTIVNVHERSSLRIHWQTRVEGVVEQRPLPIPAPRVKTVLVGSATTTTMESPELAAVAETVELTRSEPPRRLDGDESWMSEEGGGSFAVSAEGDSEDAEATVAPALKFKTELNEANPAVALVMSPVSRTIVDVSETTPTPKPRIRLEGDDRWDNDDGETSFAVTGEEANADEYEVEGHRRQRVPETVAVVATVATVEAVPRRHLDELKSPEDDKQRYSLTEEEKLRSKQEIENIWALAENREGRSASPSPEKKEAAAATMTAAPKVESVAEPPKTVAESPVVRSAQRLISNGANWEDESVSEGGKLKRYEGVEPLLASLAHIKSKYDTEETEKLDFSFLEEYIGRPEFASAMKVHNRVIEVSSENGPMPIVSHARLLLDDAQKTVAAEDRTPEDDELAAILINPHFQGVCYAHDRIAERDFAPPTPVLEGLKAAGAASPVPIEESVPSRVIVQPVNAVPDDEGVSPIESRGPMRIVLIEREGTDPIGLTVRRDDNNGRIFVSRIMRNSKADRKRELSEGDEILQINRKPVQGKTIDGVADIMKSAPGSVELGLRPSDELDGHADQTEIFVKANFSYNPSDDPYLPCDELGLTFKTGDILHVFNQSDSLWWQATLAGDSTREFAALIPGREMQEKKDAALPKLSADDDVDFGKRRKKKKRSCLPNKSKKRRHLYRPGDGTVGYMNDEDQVVPYEQVIKVDPNPRHRRPIVLIGPDGIGRRSVVQHLISLDGQKFASVLPETSRSIRPGELDGETYRFIAREQMERDFRGNLYVEYGELNGNYYGTRTSSIQSVIDSGRVCLLSLHQKALKLLKQSELKPYVIFLRPGDHGPTPSSPGANGHSNGASDDTLKIQQNEARYIEAHFGHYVDQTIVLGSVAGASKEIMAVVDRLATRPQWIYAAWDR